MSLTTKKTTVTSGTRVTLTGTVRFQGKKPAKGVSVRMQTRLVGSKTWRNSTRVRTNSKGAYKQTLIIARNTQIRMFVGNKSIKKKYSRTLTITATQKIWITSIPKNVEHYKEFTVSGKTTPGLRGALLHFTTPWYESESDENLGQATVSRTGTFSARITPGLWAKPNKALNISYWTAPGLTYEKYYGIARYNVWDWYSVSLEHIFGGIYGSDYQAGSFTMNGGRTYGALVTHLDNVTPRTSLSIPTNDGLRKCDRLSLSVGQVENQSDVNFSAAVSGDGKTLWSQSNIGPLKIYPASLNIAGLAHVTFTSTMVNNTGTSDPHVLAAWIGPRAHCLVNAES